MFMMFITTGVVLVMILAFMYLYHNTIYPALIFIALGILSFVVFWDSNEITFAINGFFSCVVGFSHIIFKCISMLTKNKNMILKPKQCKKLSSKKIQIEFHNMNKL